MILTLVVVLVVMATVLFTLFIRTQDVPAAEAESPTKHLEDRKAIIYENLRDLQFEYRVGKLSDADYQTTKVALQQELAGVLAAIDKKAPPPATAAAAPAAVQAETPEIAPGTVCPHCDAHFQKSMKFCGECGKAMA